MSEPINLIKGDDKDIEQASAHARATFKYFWRELYWERRRIVPGLGLAVIKLAFTDGMRNDGNPEVEHMWVDEVTFDGDRVGGVLISSPNWVGSVAQGDFVSAPFGELGDWMFSANDLAYGGYTVNVLRAQMPTDELEAHDEAWGLDFGPPHLVRLTYGDSPEKPGTNRDFVDHPMCTNMLSQVDEQLQKEPCLINDADENGWTILHNEALAGNLGIVQLLLKHGCNVNRKTKDGKLASELAGAIGWTAIENLLKTREAR